MEGALGALSEPTLGALSAADGGIELGCEESRFGFGGGASLREVGDTES
jgi:hypothetical protein